MTLAAPRSRQGKLTLVLAILAAVVGATVGTFLWTNQASALPNTTVSWVAAPASGTVNPGDTLTYDAHFDLVGGGSTGNTVFTVDLPDNLTNITDFGSLCGGGVLANGAGNVYTCTVAAGVVAGTYWIHVTGDAPASGSIGSAGAKVCDTLNCEPATGLVDSATTQTVAGVTCIGGGSFLTGSEQTVSCTVPIGLTYCSDNDTQDPRTFDADPTTGDMAVTLAGGATITAGPSAGLADATAADTAQVTVTGPLGGSASVVLSTHLSSSDAGPGDCTATEAVVVNFVGVADLGGAFLRHVDSDCGTEYAFDAGDNYLQSGSSDGDYDGWAPAEGQPTCNGLLSDADISAGQNELCSNAVTQNCYSVDDLDDAIGSEHSVCIIGGALTSDNNADISWTVTPTADHQEPAVINNNKTAIDVNGDDTPEPCVSWRVGDVGVEQIITAQYDPTGEDIFSNGVRITDGPQGGQCVNFDGVNGGDEFGPCQVLIKEWNSIDSTVLVQNTGNRDGNDCVAPSGDNATCANANLDGETINVNGVTNLDGFVDPSVSDTVELVDYVLGSHSPNYNGPIDGAEQTLTVTGECGTVTTEDPLDANNEIVLTPGDEVTYPANSDKGLGISIAPTNLEAALNCVDGECIQLAISTVESSLFDSNDPDSAADESIEVCYNAGPGPEKQPMLAWVGQRVVLSTDWSDPADGSCPWYPIDSNDPNFYVRYLIQAPSPGALSNVPGNDVAVATGPDYIVVPVTPEDNCISYAIYESQNQGRVDVAAHVVEVLGGSDFSVVSPEYDFWYYYMKIEDVTLGIVPGARSDHNAGSFTSSGADVTTVTENVSADELLRVTVRGWVLADNCPVKDAGADINGLLLPANRCTFPTDWAQVVGDDDQFDILGASPSSCTNVAGPFSLLNGLPPQNCDDDSSAPHVDGGFRRSVFSNGSVGTEDAPMPPALITLNLEGSGFLRGADKADIYPASNQYFATHIPAEPQILVAGSGYQWHTWNGTGDRSGLYDFWTDLAGASSNGFDNTTIISCPGDNVGDTDTPADGQDNCVGGVDTGGYDMIQIYSDNHGEAMAWVNGDANLTFDECNNNLSGHAIVQLSGNYCELNDLVGTSTITANADYPDKKPHQDVNATPEAGVTINWTWGGSKDIAVVDDPADATGQFNYVVFRVTDRDGGCSENNSLHPVLGETVQFTIDSQDAGIIFDDANGNASALGDTPNNSKTATVVTFDADDPQYGAIDDLTEPPADRISFDPSTDVCEAWIHVSESNLNQVNVIVVAFDPEGTVTFDTNDINPTPTPAPITPSPTPFTLNLTWGDSDCNGAVAARDGQAILKHFLDQEELSVSEPCPSLSERVMIDGTEQMWGDWDCNEAVAPRDGQASLKEFLSQTPPAAIGSPCPGLGDAVAVQILTP